MKRDKDRMEGERRSKKEIEGKETTSCEIHQIYTFTHAQYMSSLLSETEGRRLS